jgi:hypothetical protein
MTLLDDERFRLVDRLQFEGLIFHFVNLNDKLPDAKWWFTLIIYDEFKGQAQLLLHGLILIIDNKKMKTKSCPNND